MVKNLHSTTPVKIEQKKNSVAKNESPNCGKLIVDAPSVPAEISYPTDLYQFYMKLHRIKILLIPILHEVA